MKELKPIIDVCCGGKMFHCDKDNPDVLFMDIRKEPAQKLSNGATFSVQPDIIGDFRNIPFPNDTFYMVIFDPPHLRCGEKSFLFKKYGTLNTDWRHTIKRGFEECFRVLKPFGTLVFKWSDSFQPLSKVLELCPAEPIITYASKSQSKKKKTHFLIFMKKENKNK